MNQEEELKSVGLENIFCPVCGNKINWVKPVGNYNFNHKGTLLAQCWSGNIDKTIPEHLFLILLENLPSVEMDIKLLVEEEN